MQAQNNKEEIFSFLNKLKSVNGSIAVFQKLSNNTDKEILPNEIIFDLKKVKPDKEVWKDIFSNIEPIQSVVSMNIDIKTANWDSEILELTNKVFPNIIKLKIYTKLKNEPTELTLNYTNLEELDITIDKKPNIATLKLNGFLPNLHSFKLVHYGKSKIDNESIVSLLSSSKILDKVVLYYLHGWSLARKIVEEFLKKSISTKIDFIIRQSPDYMHGYGMSQVEYNSENSYLYESDWNDFLFMHKNHFSIDVESYFPIVDTKERFLLVSEFLKDTICSMYLTIEHHSYLQKEPELLMNFSKLEYLRIFGSNELTQDRLNKLLSILSNLKHLVLLNNHNPELSILEIRSNSLKEITITHFTHLNDFLIQSESLEKIELDNCNDTSIENYPDKDILWTYGNYGEQFLTAFLNNDNRINVPNLKTLMIWHNQNGFGPQLVFESLRMDILCNDGHSNLEELYLSRLSHIRSLELKNLPKLIALSIYDDFEDGDGYFEKLEISELSKNCITKIECGITDKSKMAEDLEDLKKKNINQ